MDFRVHKSTHFDIYISVPELEQILQGLKDKATREEAIAKGQVIKTEDHSFHDTIHSGEFSITFHHQLPNQYVCELRGGKEVWLPSP
jgi:hypothetical protein